MITAKPAAPKFLSVKAGRIIRYSGIPWEGDGAVSAGTTSFAYVAGPALANFAMAGYVALGALVLISRATRDVIGALGARLALLLVTEPVGLQHLLAGTVRTSPGTTRQASSRIGTGSRAE